MKLTVTIKGRAHLLGAGDHLVFGRDPGDQRGVITDDSRVSARHGRIDVAEQSWSLTSLGTYTSFVVYDRVTPSKLSIPLHVGPVPIPFGHALIVVELGHHRIPIAVDADVEPIDGWARGWSSHLKSTWEATRLPDSGTIVQWNDLSWKQKSGRPRAWFKVLVAMCEPRLAPPFEERVPTNPELAARLGLATTNAIANTHIPRIRKELGLVGGGEVKTEAVVIAIAQGIVTADDLHVLNLAVADEDGSAT